MNTTKVISNTPVISWVYFLFLSVTWGSSYILIKRGLEGYTIWQSATIRLVVASLIMVYFATRHIKKIPATKIKYVFISSLFSMVLPSYLFCAAQANLNSSMAGVLNALTPAFACLVGLLFFNRTIKISQMAGLIIGFLGTAFLISVNAKTSISLNGYALFVVLAALCYGININFVKNYLSDVNPLHITTVAVSFAGFLAMIFLFCSGYKSYMDVKQHQVLPLTALLTLGVFGTAFAQIALNQLIKVSSVEFASSNTYVIPVVAVLWGVLDGEGWGLWHFVGMAAILIGVLILNGKGLYFSKKY